MDWRCQTALGEMLFEFSERPALRGHGYAECLTTTIPPWKLPIDELRWGRWISAAASLSLVWIEWRGAHPLTAVYADGALIPSARVTDDAIDLGGAMLDLHQRNILHSRSLVETLGCIRPVLEPLLPTPWLAVQDCKWRSSGTLRTASAPPAKGWVIHEWVRFP